MSAGWAFRCDTHSGPMVVIDQVRCTGCETPSFRAIDVHRTGVETNLPALVPAACLQGSQGECSACGGQILFGYEPAQVWGVAN